MEKRGLTASEQSNFTICRVAASAQDGQGKMQTNTNFRIVVFYTNRVRCH